MNAPVPSARSASGYQTLRPHGGYRRLRSFRTTQVIYDATVAFCARFVDRRSRTVDQMVQAARSGRQNIAEGSRASATSSQTELKLVGVARASLDELLLDYEDFLRQRHLPLWPKDDPQARRVRDLGPRSHNPSDPTDQSDPPAADPYAPYRAWVEESDAATAANTVICLIHQANYLLDQQIRALERQFIEGGGYREQLHAARLNARAEAQAEPAPACPLCGGAMRLRTARQGPHPGKPFWGCAAFPTCHGTRPHVQGDPEPSVRSDGSDRSVR